MIIAKYTDLYQVWMKVQIDALYSSSLLQSIRIYIRFQQKCSKMDNTLAILRFAYTTPIQRSVRTVAANAASHSRAVRRDSRRPPALGWARADLVVCSVVVFSLVGGSGRGLGSGWVVPFSSGGYLRAFQRQRVSPRARRGFVREVSPYSSLLGRYPFGRGVLGRRSRFKTPLKFRYPAPRGNASEAPKSRLNCASPSARRRWRWAVRLRNGFSVGTGATRAARQHPRGRLRRCPAGSASAQNRARRFSATQARLKTAPRVAAPSGDRYAVGGYALGFPPPAGVAPLFNERDDAAHDLPAKCRGVRRARPSAILAYRRESFPARGVSGHDHGR